MKALVLDTNIVLDLWVYDDPRTQALPSLLTSDDCIWWATQAMQDELARVLEYPHIADRLRKRQRSAPEVLQLWTAATRLCAEAPKAPCTCKDPDDQKFIDLACLHQACLVSKDKAVLTMRNRLARLGVTVQREWQN